MQGNESARVTASSGLAITKTGKGREREESEIGRDSKSRAVWMDLEKKTRTTHTPNPYGSETQKCWRCRHDADKSQQWKTPSQPIIMSIIDIFCGGGFKVDH